MCTNSDSINMCTDSESINMCSDSINMCSDSINIYTNSDSININTGPKKKFQKENSSLLLPNDLKLIVYYLLHTYNVLNF